ncbi:hypothetical protein [Microbacterium sp. NPDC056569]|uniref:hypothetical protein n=1 Tax=Microbacterium sp. NPDC056569 TaxID=3345867 RepID=UPI00366DAE9C
MNGWVLTLALTSAAVNAFGVFGGWDAVKGARAEDHVARTAGWYLAIRCAALAVAALVGALGVWLAWRWEITGWVFAVAAITVLVQLLDVPVWLSRPDRWKAAAAFFFAVVVGAVGAVALLSL